MPAPRAFTPDVLADRLAALAPGWPDLRLCVAFSGGVDSVSLLHATREVAARHPSVGLRAVHVDHGLQPGSPQWAERCQELCRRLGVPCTVVGLGLAVAKGESVEAEARRERYAAFAAQLRAGECLLTAHHADDQLETVLLQLFRGAGAAGLAAMPGSGSLGAGWHLRPLLDVERQDLVAYATALGLDWIEDPMNTESRFDRAYLRCEVLPAIRRRWPAVARTVGRSARHLAEAQRLLESLARADGEPLVDEGGQLGIAGLALLARERQVNVLRWWIVAQGLGPPSTARLEAILRDILPARDDAQPIVTWPAGEVRRYRGQLYAMRPLGPLPPSGWRREIRLGETIELPCGLGSLHLTTGPTASGDPAATRASFTVRFPRPEDRVAVALERRPGPFPEWCRASRVPPWMRARLPVLCVGEGLVAPPGAEVPADLPSAVAGARLSWIRTERLG